MKTQSYKYKILIYILSKLCLNINSAIYKAIKVLCTIYAFMCIKTRNNNKYTYVTIYC